MRRITCPILFLLLRQFSVGDPRAAGKFPCLGHGRRVIAMFDVPSPLQDERLESFLAQLLGGPSSADSRADHNGIIGVLLSTGALDIHGKEWGPQGARAQMSSG